ncbi:MAG: protein kinase [Myxococcales bacterium]|nr:protein kinase [Myxococcales bacterium]MCB9716098.1 protein kinase [Myxococcales bacterium]
MHTASEAIDTETLPARLPKGFVVGDYVVDGWVRDGGMAAIYRAHHESSEARVALKLQLPSTVHLPEICARFEHEAHALRRLRGHDNVVELHESELLEDGRRYFVLEWMEGEDLEERLDFLRNQDQRLPVDSACRIGAMIARGLASVHTEGLVHRDLKPANVMLGRDGEQEIAKLVDFGIVADLREPEPIHQGDAGHGDHSVMGTSAYMAPEQAEGRPAAPGMDLFALGVLLYEALTGTCVPPDGWTPESLPTVESLRRNLPSGLADLVRACMSSDPALRPASAAVVADQLDLLASGDLAAASMVSMPVVEIPVRTGGTTVAPRSELLADSPDPHDDPAEASPAPTPSAPSSDDTPQTAPSEETFRGTEVVHLRSARGATDVPVAVPRPSSSSATPIASSPAVGSGAHPMVSAPSPTIPPRPGGTELMTHEEVLSRSGMVPVPPLRTAVVPTVPARAPTIAPTIAPSVHREPRRARWWLLVVPVIILTALSTGIALQLGGGGGGNQNQAASSPHHPPAPTEPGDQPHAVEAPPIAAPPSVQGDLRPPAEDSPRGEPNAEAGTTEVDHPEPTTESAAAGRPHKEPTRAECTRLRGEAQVAKKDRRWADVLKATQKRPCWKGKDGLERKRLRVEAFAETGNYTRCVAEGGRSKDNEIKRRVKLCSSRLAG